jgi:hypothetical protein
VKRGRVIAVAVVAVAALGACSGAPNAKAVAIDMVKSLDLPPERRDCMIGKLENYTADELDALGDANLTIDFNAEDPVAQGDESYQQFVADLESCA